MEDYFKYRFGDDISFNLNSGDFISIIGNTNDLFVFTLLYGHKECNLFVGDKEFKGKCLKTIKELSSEGNITMLLVTHSLEQAKEFCDRGIILNKGHIVYDAPIDEAIKEYNKLF